MHTTPDLFGADDARQRLARERALAERIKAEDAKRDARRAAPKQRAAKGASGSKLFDAYKAWDRANPQFYPLFCRFALQLAARGVRTTGVALVWERIRWETMVTTTGDGFKANNNHRAYYARRFMRDHPQHATLFRVRELSIDVGDDQL